MRLESDTEPSQTGSKSTAKDKVLNTQSGQHLDQSSVTRTLTAQSLNVTTKAASTPSASAPSTSAPSSCERKRTATNISSGRRCPLQIIDSHCHIDLMMEWKRFGCLVKSFGDLQRFVLSEQIHRPTVTVDIVNFITNFCDPDYWMDIDQIVRSDERIKYTIGIHPRHLVDSYVRRLEMDMLTCHLENKDACIGFGEIGLDFHYADSYQRRTMAISNFTRMVKLFKVTCPQKTLVLHIRRASDWVRGMLDPSTEALRILREEGLTSTNIHLHCFSLDVGAAERWLSTFPNLCFGFTAKLLHPEDRARLSHVVERLPAVRLVAETDSPFQKPPNRRGPNHPWHIHIVVERFAEIKGKKLEAMYQQVMANTRRLYHL